MLRIGPYLVGKLRIDAGDDGMDRKGRIPYSGRCDVLANPEIFGIVSSSSTDMFHHSSVSFISLNLTSQSDYPTLPPHLAFFLHPWPSLGPLSSYV